MKRIKGKKNILNLLHEFDDVFPHNKEKIDDYAKWAKKISDHGVVTVLEHDCEIAGLAVFYENDYLERKGYISLIGLKKQYIGKGLGRAFLDEIIAEMKMQEMLCVYLEVDNDNSQAADFYMKYGFVVEQRKDTTKVLKYIF